MCLSARAPGRMEGESWKLAGTSRENKLSQSTNREWKCWKMLENHLQSSRFPWRSICGDFHMPSRSHPSVGTQNIPICTRQFHYSISTSHDLHPIICHICAMVKTWCTGSPTTSPTTWDVLEELLRVHGFPVAVPSGPSLLRFARLHVPGEVACLLHVIAHFNPQIEKKSWKTCWKVMVNDLFQTICGFCDRCSSYNF